MTTTAVKPVAIRKPPTTARSRRRVGGRTRACDGCR